MIREMEERVESKNMLNRKTCWIAEHVELRNMLNYGTC